MSSYENLIAVGSLLSGAGAMISALIAWNSVRISSHALQRASEQDAQHVWGAIAVQSARAEAMSSSVERVGNELKLAYSALFTFAGQGSKSGRLKVYLDRVDQTLSEASEIAANCRRISQNFSNPCGFDYSSATDSLARLEANVIKLDVVLDMLKDEHSGIERQNYQHRAKALQPQPAKSPYGSGSPPER